VELGHKDDFLTENACMPLRSRAGCRMLSVSWFSQTSRRDLKVKCQANVRDPFSSAGCCSKAVLGSDLGHGKSPCFSGYAFFVVVDLDRGGLVLAVVNIALSLECAC